MLMKLYRKQEWNRLYKRSLKNQMINIDKYRVAVIITEYHIISKLILLKIIIPKSMIRQCMTSNDAVS